MFIPKHHLCLAFLFQVAHLALGAVFNDPKELPNKQWDFIVVGAGTAGAVIASRLSEDPNTSVLVIEAGVSNTGGADVDTIQVPFLVSGASPNTPYDWNYTTTSQVGLNGRTMPYPRGFVLGGSSSINYMAFTRGSKDEFNHFASVSGNPIWNWDNIFPYALKNEKHVDSADHHNTTGQFNPSVHGFNGPLLTSLPGNPTDIDARIINTTQELSSEFPFNLDMNSGNPLGVGWLQSTVGNSVRSSSATAYLNPALKTRTNIDLLMQTQVTRLIQTSGSRPNLPEFLGVELARDNFSPRFISIARKEVILSAGSIGTPQILMLSGIGDKRDLGGLGIHAVVDVPDVGRNLQDHAYFTLSWSVTNNKTFDTVVDNPAAFSAALAQYERTGQGLFANNAIANHIGFLRIPDSSDIIRKFGDPTSGPLSPHYEFAFCNGFVGTTQTPPTSGNFFSTAVVVVSPTSVGSVTLTSASPFDHPLIDPALLATEFDIEVAVEAVKSLRRFLSATPWQGYLSKPFIDAVNTTTDQGIKDYARKTAISIRHPVATAKISKSTDTSGVVGPDLIVKKIKGVRIVDASVIPKAIAAHPQAFIYILAERAADLIKADHGLPILPV